jgi:hypothetical protein
MISIPRPPNTDETACTPPVEGDRESFRGVGEAYARSRSYSVNIGTGGGGAGDVVLVTSD